MRISTSMIFDAGRNTLMQQTADMTHTQQQLATGRRVLTPSDDPIAAARALEVSQSKSVNEQFQTNQGYAKDSLSVLDSSLGNIGDTLQYIRSRAVEAGNGTFSPAELQSLASDVEGQFNALMATANSKDATGDYLFAGFRSGQAAFSGGAAAAGAGPAAVTYNGDEGSRTMQVGPSRVMPVAEPGSKVFQVDPTTGQSQMLGAISNFITELRKAPTDPTRNIAGAVQTAIGGMDSAIDNVSTIRASVGSRMVELDAQVDLSSQHNLEYSDTLSRLQDLDYNEAISRFSQQQTVLQAAQQSYVRVTGLSLFNLLK